ncbi:hypothetical protein [Rhodopirellula bahusiensis]|uniref:hypothetical protein n=1 Tax=Rhodopirellula bahusiensis TaxID=2014065 RepID=UPI0032631E8B
MQTNFVVVDVFDHVVDAEMLAMLLTHEGLTPRLMNNHTVGMNWMHSGAYGGVKVNVPEPQAAHAKQIASQLRTQSKARLEVMANSDEDACLACGNEMVEDNDECGECGWSYGQTGHTGD